MLLHDSSAPQTSKLLIHETFSVICYLTVWFNIERVELSVFFNTYLRKGAFQNFFKKIPLPLLQSFVGLLSGAA